MTIGQLMNASSGIICLPTRRRPQSNGASRNAIPYNRSPEGLASGGIPTGAVFASCR